MTSSVVRRKTDKEIEPQNREVHLRPPETLARPIFHDLRPDFLGRFATIHKLTVAILFAKVNVAELSKSVRREASFEENHPLNEKSGIILRQFDLFYFLNY